jgi:hypothetical protein
VSKEKAAIRLHCSCGWEKWIKFDPKISNEEIKEMTDPILHKHMESHSKYENN